MSVGDTNSLLKQAVALESAGRHAEADALCARILERAPAHTDALILRARVQSQLGNHAAAIALAQTAIRIDPRRAAYHETLGTIFLFGGRTAEAAEAFGSALRLAPNSADPILLANFASALFAQRRYDEAVVHLRRAVSLDPNFAQGWHFLGLTLWTLAHTSEAIAAFQRVTELSPQDHKAFSYLGAVLLEKGRLVEAAAALERTLAINPADPFALNNLARVRSEEGDVASGVELYRRSLAADPTSHLVHSNLAYEMHFHPTASPDEVFAEQLRWAKLHADPRFEPGRIEVTDQNLDRKLRIAYFSPDLRQHVIGLYIEPALEHHDRAHFEVYTYADVARPDAAGARMAARADVARNVAALSDDDLAALIRRDKIDILIDLCNHMANNRLRILGRRLAPVQINYLAYPATSGIKAMDYAITDPYLDPPGSSSERLYTEKLLRLPHSYWCYGQPTESPDVGPLPSLAHGFVTFSSLNNAIKFNAGVLSVWSRILAAVPYSRLMVLVAGDEKSIPSRREYFARGGIDPARVDFVPRQVREKYLAAFNGADIGLDPFPYNGHTTTLESFWMGVPVVTLEGNSSVSRAGVSVLRNLGLPELIAKNPDEYVRIAVDLAGDLNKLAALRPTLRDRLLRSPIADAATHTRDLEAAYRQAWREWCSKSPS